MDNWSLRGKGGGESRTVGGKTRHRDLKHINSCNTEVWLLSRSELWCNLYFNGISSFSPESVRVMNVEEPFKKLYYEKRSRDLGNFLPSPRVTLFIHHVLPPLFRVPSFLVSSRVLPSLTLPRNVYSSPHHTPSGSSCTLYYSRSL